MTRATIHRLAALLVGSAALLTAQLACASAPVQHPQEQQQPTLAAAAAAERDGDYTSAEAAYRTLAGAPDRATSIAATLALGRLLERQGRSAEALVPLQTATGALGAAPDGLRATFLLGEAQAEQHQNQAAASSFQSYLAGGGAAAGNAAIQRALALQADGDDNGAVMALVSPLQAASLNVRRSALQAASHSHERLGDPARAAADQQALVDTQPLTADRVNALLEQGRLDHLAGDDTGAARALQEVVQKDPSTSTAGTALDRLDALGIDVDPLQRAVVLFDQHRYDDAQAALQRLQRANQSGDLAAQAAYYLARIADHEDQNDTALAGYTDAYTLEPAGPVAADSIWRRAELLRYLRRYGDAQGIYASLVQRFPQSANAAEAAFDAGLMAYLDGRPADAATAWTAAAHSAGGADAARADLWLGKLAQANGDRAAAASAFSQARAAQPAGYYGLRAEVLATGMAVGLSGNAVAPPANGWGAAESWLASWAGPEDKTQFQALQATQNWSEGMELISLGWKTTPGALLGAAVDGIAQQPWTLYRAARALADQGRTDLALDAADRLLKLAGVTPGGPPNVPAALLRLAYPLDYVNLVNQNAAQNGLDPLLVFAVARQESTFDPAAGSSAGAQGLLQLEPATAQGEADTLGMKSFAAADLQRPLVNIELGTAFLGEQAIAADKELNRTLAAYNAGGGNADRWAQQAGGDADRFYETVDFSETRSYIRLVSANYAMYVYLYRATPRPTLLHP